MTEKQNKDFIAIAQLGIACGLMHPFEWLNNIIVNVDMLYIKETESEKKKIIENAIEVFVEFFKKCGYEYDEDNEFNESLTKDKLIEIIDSYLEN